MHMGFLFKPMVKGFLPTDYAGNGVPIAISRDSIDHET
jgi:hypothetical protein